MGLWSAVRDNGRVSQTDPSPTAPTPPTPHTPSDASAAPRAPLPGEPGFKAPLTEKQLKRASQTVKGMVISVVLTLAVALPVVFLNPGSNVDTYRNRINVDEIAQQTVTTQNFQAISPQFPQGWYANAASWNPGAADGVGFWQLGIVKDDTHYAKVLQADKANPSWISLATEGSVPTGQTVDVDGTAWEQRVLPASKSPQTILTTKISGYTFVITADQGEDAFLTETARLVQVSAAAK